MSAKIVLISGPQGVGKTTLVNTLIPMLQKSSKIRAFNINFADVIYKIHDYARNILSENGAVIDFTKKDGPLLQLLGTEWARERFGPNVWVNVVKHKIKRAESMGWDGTRVYLIGDCRFESEFDGFEDALRIRLVCDRDVRKERCSAWRDKENHQSEIDLNKYEVAGKFDFVFDSGKLSADSIATLVHAQIQKWTFMEKRQ